MKYRHWFEFMDLPWLPLGLKTTLREILECGNGPPFRNYYPWVAQELLKYSAMHGVERIVELGAGTAPICRALVAAGSPANIELIASDLYPDPEVFRTVVNRSHGRIQTLMEPVDFSQARDWPPNTLLCLSASFHHLPPASRLQALASLSSSGNHVFVFEPLQKTALSVAFVFLSLTPALLTPLRFLNHPGGLRRAFWCWLPPIAPMLFLWDGVISCLRMWTADQWAHAAQSVLGKDSQIEIEEAGFCQKVAWHRAGAPAQKSTPRTLRGVLG